MTSTYSTDSVVNELLSGVNLPSGVVVDNFRVEAYNNINASLRKIYIVPIESTDTTDVAILKSIESKRSAGRVLMAVATLHEMENLSEYGQFLLEESEKELDKLRKEDLILSIEATRDTDDSDEVIDPPVLSGNAPDEYSTFGRPMSGIENDAIDGVIDSEEYNSLEDNKTL